MALVGGVSLKICIHLTFGITSVLIVIMPVTLYNRQRQILDFIAQYIQRNGYSPTLQEIANALGVSSLATVHEHLGAMVKKGVIKRFEGSVRGIDILDKETAQRSSSMVAVELPILGFIAAGSPIEPFTDPNATFGVPPAMVSPKKRCFVLQVKGDSMIEAGIYDRDYVVVEQTETARDGEVVVALLDNGFATLKRFFREATRVRLEPANSTMSPIFVAGDKVRIQGKVVGVIRRYGVVN
ncbi:MAG: LexA repressor [Candidatus Amesbacteria bacterium GW2011_GWA2_47_11]|uniref:LexA repressor n=4 Tax=Candidatus Amesiibacteriota TaxID=1752730 RepID=A0A0G1UGG6_9BACT|nr:MAG: LexA repressor [Candidatus Amesbacteria bacterium GW2011_GWA2_47_11]KKU93216.1 MAG: LexA repressor [Candidatus Amesbacteria bacterium GW2011_GWC1_48_10]KKU99872.1 MAG: LexA repressor [Candidatus Amesbacteria bacterium GW2011_GWA1_48_9]